LEWVPKGDPMVQRLLAARDDIFADYSADGLRAAFRGDFEIVEEAPIDDSTRILFRMRALA
nr:SAM-dependent methyltransferase [Chloroflexota bacterium]